MEFICMYTECHHRDHFPDQEPERWLVGYRYAERGEYRRKCPKCGAAMAPFSYIAKPEGGSYLSEDAFLSFSECVNAGKCNGFDCYRPDCEMPGLKQRCLRFLSQEITGLHDRLDTLEQSHWRKPK